MKGEESEVEALTLIVFAVGVAIGHYTVFSLFLTKGFVKRFSNFKNSFDNWMISELDHLAKELPKRIKEIEPSELVDIIAEWTDKQMVVRDILGEYNELGKTTKRILLSLGDTGADFLHIAFPKDYITFDTQPIYWINVALFLTFVAVVLIFNYIWKFHTLNERIHNLNWVLMRLI